MWLRARLGWLQECQMYCFPPSPSVTALPSLTHGTGTGTLLPSFLLKLPNTNGAASQDQHLAAGEAPVLPAPRSVTECCSQCLRGSSLPHNLFGLARAVFFFHCIKKRKKNTENQSEKGQGRCWHREQCTQKRARSCWMQQARRPARG